MKLKGTVAAPGETLAVPVNKRDHIQGGEKAQRTLVEYGDYQCPYCGEAWAVVKELQKQLGSRVRFVYRNFPLAEIHPHAEHAAEAAEAAGAQGRFWEMHDMLYQNQEALEDEDIAEYAAALGLDPERLMREVEAGTYRARLREDFEGGVRSGVNGTPTFFIDDVRYEGSDDLDSLVAALTK